MKRNKFGIIFIFLALLAVISGRGVTALTAQQVERTALSFDSVKIVYSVQGKQEPSLVFIHGGFADRSYWINQMKHFSQHHRVVTIDLAGHGESGKNRKKWNISSFAKDLAAVVKKENIQKAVLIGNSLGGPVALEAARLLGEKAVMVVAVDTLQNFFLKAPPGYYKNMANAYRNNFAETMKQMVNALFHPGTFPELKARAEKEMLEQSPEMAGSLMESFEGLDMVKMVEGLTIPIRCINGDLIPTVVEKNRTVYPDYDAVVLPDTGHYPMLEVPEKFNHHLEMILKELNEPALPFLIDFDFEGGKAPGWKPRNPKNWVVAKEQDSYIYGNLGPGEQGQVRAPTSWSLLEAFDVSSFIFSGKVRCEADVSNPHRDIVILFHYQDPTHFYYVHFSASSDNVHNIIGIVNGRDREKINIEKEGESAARLIDLKFHEFKVTYNAETGEIKAYMDDMEKPILTAVDRTLGHGLVGIGSFDDKSGFDDIKLWGKVVQKKNK